MGGPESNVAMGRLDGRVALITGAARGIGRAIAECFHAEGSYVLLSDINDAEGSVAAACLGDRVEYHHLDVSAEDDWERVAAEISRSHGRLDVLVNNAAITGLLEPGSQDPEHFDLATWHHVHEVNLDGVALGCKYGRGHSRGLGGPARAPIRS